MRREKKLEGREQIIIHNGYVNFNHKLVMH